MAQKIFLFLFLLVTLIFAGCKKEDPIPVADYNSAQEVVLDSMSVRDNYEFEATTHMKYELVVEKNGIITYQSFVDIYAYNQSVYVQTTNVTYTVRSAYEFFAAGNVHNTEEAQSQICDQPTTVHINALKDCYATVKNSNISGDTTWVHFESTGFMPNCMKYYNSHDSTPNVVLHNQIEDPEESGTFIDRFLIFRLEE